MTGCDCDEACPEDRIGPSGEDLDGVDAVDWLCEPETEVQPLALADPILLHHPHLLGPVIEGLQTVEQVLGEVGDLQEPLR